MPTLVVETQIKGLIPALDPRQVNKYHVLNGQNFFVDAKGPRSAFGARYSSFVQLADLDNVTNFEIDGEFFTCTEHAILKYDVDSQYYIPMITFIPSADYEYPWYYTKVGTQHFFCKKGCGLFAYTPTTETWEKITVTGTPTLPCAIAMCGGRLVVVGDDVITWSAIDDGTNLTTDVDLGIGSQAVVIVGGTVLGMLATYDGVIVYTTNGMLKGQLLEAVNPFSWWRLSGKEFVPINPFCMVNVKGQTNTILTATGFYTTSGKLPEPFAPEMGEYFAQNIFPQLGIADNAIINGVAKLWYGSREQFLFISFALSGVENRFTRAFVYYYPKQEFGSFDHEHIFVGPVHSIFANVGGYTFGYIDPDGYSHRIHNGAFNEVLPDLENFFFKHTAFEIAGYYDTDHYVMSTFMAMFTQNPTTYPNVSGLYTTDLTAMYDSPEILGSESSDFDADDSSREDWLFALTDENWLSSIDPDEDWLSGDINLILASGLFMQNTMLYYGLRAVAPEFSSINSRVEVGLFRFTEQKTPDELSFVDVISIGTGTTEQDTQTMIDWLTASVNEDWLALTGVDDFGFNVITEADYDLTMDGTIDGIEVFEENSTTPEIIKEQGGVRFYDTYVVGLYHKLNFDASAEGQSFHLKSLELSGNLCGRI